MAVKKTSSAQLKKFKEDILFFRMSMVFILACCAVMAILRLNSGRNGMAFWELSRNPLYIGIVSLVFVASVVWFIINKRNKKDETVTTFASINFVAVTGYILGCSLYWGNSTGPSATVLMIATICLALLYFIYYIFKRDFFIFSLANLVFAATLWVFGLDTLFTAIAGALMLAVSVLVCLVAYRLSRINAAGKSVSGESYFPCYISFLIAVVLICCVNFFSAITLLTAAAVMLVQYVLAGIYYTVKLIKEA